MLLFTKMTAYDQDQLKETLYTDMMHKSQKLWKKT